MNVYDFDGTIYNGDSTLDFYLFCFRRNFKIVSEFPKQLKGFFLHAFGKIDRTKFKEYFYSFLLLINTQENIIDEFWKLNKKKIKEWYLQQKSENDVVISASPVFLLEPICNELGIKKLIASGVDFATGKALGKNCKGEEKVKRFFAEFPNGQIEKFYSDSKSDVPLKDIAKESFLVKGNKIYGWK